MFDCTQICVKVLPDKRVSVKLVERQADVKSKSFCRGKVSTHTHTSVCIYLLFRFAFKLMEKFTHMNLAHCCWTFFVFSIILFGLIKHSALCSRTMKGSMCNAITLHCKSHTLTDTFTRHFIHLPTCL